MDNDRKRKNIILAVVVLLAAAAMAALPMILSSSKPEPEDGAAILSARVERGDIRSTISGGGTLTDESGIIVSAPHGVEITDYLVRNGELVEAGQPLCQVDKNSVMSTIAVVQKNLEYLQKELRKQVVTAGGTRVVTSPLAGRVKVIYAKPGDKVADVMAEHGALCVLSLDGLMAATVETDLPLEPGEPVNVVLPDGKTLPGKAEVRQGRSLTATFSDDGPRPGEEVKLTTADGAELGRGACFIHSAWNLTGTNGTVDNILTKEEQLVIWGSRLVHLTNLEDSGEYDRLAGMHRDYEDTMRKLFEIYANGAVVAPLDGCIHGADETMLGVLRAGAPEYELTLLANGPADPMDASYVNKPARVTKVTFGSITFQVQKTGATLKSYMAAPTLSEKNLETKKMTDFTGVSIFSYDKLNERWITVYAGSLEVDDLLYFVYDKDGNLIWIVKPTQPVFSIGDLDLGGYYGGGGGEEEPFEMYDLTETRLMEVVPQNTMTVKVSVDELDILAVELGQEAEITVDALPARSYTGTVSRIDPYGENQGGNTKYTITIDIDRDPSMIAGMNATAILTVGVTENVLILPAAALSEKGSRTLVYTGYDPQEGLLLNPVEVTTGVSDGSLAEILSGLEEGTEVWYKYYEASGVPDLISGLPAANA